MPLPPSPAPVIVFDGHCRLCHATVNFILRHDRQALFRFASHLSHSGQLLLKQAGENSLEPRSFLLAEGGRTYRSSTAALRVLRLLGWPWVLFYGFILVPTPLRNLVYRMVAASRYRLFGRSSTCLLPQPGREHRFLE